MAAPVGVLRSSASLVSAGAPTRAMVLRSLRSVPKGSKGAEPAE